MSLRRLGADSLRIRASDGLYLLSYLLCMTDAILISYTTLNGTAAAHHVSVFLRISSLIVMAGKLVWDGKQRLSTLLFTCAVCLLIGVSLYRSF